VAAAVLLAGGVTGAEQARAFLSGSLSSLADPLSIRGMAEAVAVVLEAVRAGEGILVHGDYDADGICATALLVHALHRLDSPVHFYLPDRFEDDYGVSERAIRAAAAQGIRVIVTVDCGITAHEEVALANSLGCRVVVLDHHDPGHHLPDAEVVVAPRLPDWEYEGGEMPASALALRFVQALGAVSDREEALRAEELVDVAAVGIVADVAPMVGDNRVLVRAGLDRLPHTSLPGLRALQQVAGVTEPLRAYDVGFRLAPRINAVGRLGDAGDAVDLLLTNDPDEARRLALYLDQRNRERQQVQQRIYDEAVAMLAGAPELLELPVILLSSEAWHVGVVGIVASKLVEEFGRPVVLLVEMDGVARGSARSVQGFDITSALRACGELLIRCGGHPMAAGLRAEPHRVPALRQALASQADWEGLEATDEEAPEQAIPVEAGEVDESLPGDLARLEPFGPGNPEPLFVTEGLEVVEVRTVGRDSSHLKILLTDGRRTLEAIGFRMGNGERPAVGEKIDVCFVPEIDTYWGRPQLQLRLKAWVRHSGGGRRRS